MNKRRNSKLLRQRIVMLIDDNDIDNFINERMISGCGFSDIVYTNTSTISALEFLKNLEANPELRHKHWPNYIFLDINMPLLDGFQFLEQYMQIPELLRQKTRIVMLTSSINPADKERASKYTSVIDFYHKPLNEDALTEISEQEADL